MVYIVNCYIEFQIIYFSNFDFFLYSQIAKLQALDSSESELNWTKGFNIGCLVEGKIQETKDIGVVVSFDKYNDVLGFIAHHQCKFMIFLLSLPSAHVVTFRPMTCSIYNLCSSWYHC